MSSTIHLPPTTQRWLRDSPLTPYVMGYFDHLIQCRYAADNHRKVYGRHRAPGTMDGSEPPCHRTTR